MRAEQTLAVLLTTAMSPSLLRVVNAPHTCGRDEVTVTIDKTDGLAMQGSLMTQASPHTSEYKSRIEKNVLAAGEKAKAMGIKLNTPAVFGCYNTRQSLFPLNLSVSEMLTGPSFAITKGVLTP